MVQVNKKAFNTLLHQKPNTRLFVKLNKQLTNFKNVKDNVVKDNS